MSLKTCVCVCVCVWPDSLRHPTRYLRGKAVRQGEEASRGRRGGRKGLKAKRRRGKERRGGGTKEERERERERELTGA